MTLKVLPAAGSPGRSGVHDTVAPVRPLRLVHDDTAVVAGLRSQQDWARAALFDRYAADVQRVLAHILLSNDDLPDLIQEVFTRALEGVQRLENPSCLRSWMVGIAVMTAREHIRSRRRRKWLVFMPFQSLPDTAAAVAPHDARETVRATYAVLDRLDPDDRILLVLRLIEGMELTDIAEMCGCSLATAKRRIGFAQERFRAQAADEPALQDWLQGGEP